MAEELYHDCPIRNFPCDSCNNALGSNKGKEVNIVNSKKRILSIALIGICFHLTPSTLAQDLNTEEELAPGGNQGYKGVLSPGKYKFEVKTNGDGVAVGVFDEKNNLIVGERVKCSSSWNCNLLVRFTVIVRQQYTFGVVNGSSSTRRFTAKYSKDDEAQMPAQPGGDQELMTLSEEQKEVTRKALGGQSVRSPLVLLFGWKGEAGVSAQYLADVLTRMGYSAPKPGTWDGARDTPRPATETSPLAWNKRDIQVICGSVASDVTKAIARALDGQLFRATGERVGVSLAPSGSAGNDRAFIIFVPAGLSTRDPLGAVLPNEGKNPAEVKQGKPPSAQKESRKSEEKLGSELRKAAEKGQIETVRTLLEQGAVINSSDKNGRTALMFTAEKGHLEVAKLLLERGANASATDNEGESALDKAQRKRKESVLRLLQEEKARRDEEEARRVKHEITQFNEARMALLRKYQSPLSLTEEAFLADGWTMKDAVLGRLGIVSLSSSSTTLTYRLGTFDKPKSLEAAEFVQEAFDFSRRAARSQTPFQGSWPAATVVCSLEFEKVSGRLVKLVWADR